MERETGLEPATSSLGNYTSKVNNELMRSRRWYKQRTLLCASWQPETPATITKARHGKLWPSWRWCVGARIQAWLRSWRSWHWWQGLRKKSLDPVGESGEWIATGPRRADFQM